MKGKHAARTANREAARDNEIIAEQLDKIALLKTQLKQAQDDLKDEQSQRASLIVRRTAEQSAQEIALMRAEIDVIVSHQAVVNEDTADWIVTYIRGLSEDHPDMPFIPMPGIREILVKLVGDTRTTHFLAILLAGQSNASNRAYRRTGNSGINAYRNMDGREYEDSQRRLIQKIKKATVKPDQHVDEVW